MSQNQSLIFIAIGSELLSGDVIESNAHWLQNKIAHRNIKMTRIVVVEDKLSSMITTIENAIQEADHVIVCGGLGPTDDDITREAIAKAIKKDLYFNKESWNDIQNFFMKRHKKAGKSNEKQAFQPIDSEVLKNPKGTAPGFKVEIEETTLMTFPGVPSEFYLMSELYFLPLFEALPQAEHYKLWGIGESDLMDQIKEHKLIPNDLSWGTIARKEGLSLRFYPEAVTHPLYTETTQKVKSFFKDMIYTESSLTPLQVLAEKAKAGNFKIACAESCTGGLVSEWFTDIPGASSFFQGSIVAYQNEIKTQLLGVHEKILENHGAVSPECVEAMSKGCVKQLKSDLGLAVSGIAGPDGGTEHKPVGTVYISATYQGITRSKHLQINGNRNDVRERSAYALCILGLEVTESE